MRLPKTRSGKIMRRLLRELASGGEVKGDTTTLEDLSVIAKLRSDDESLKSCVRPGEAMRTGRDPSLRRLRSFIRIARYRSLTNVIGATLWRLRARLSGRTCKSQTRFHSFGLVNKAS